MCNRTKERIVITGLIILGIGLLVLTIFMFTIAHQCFMLEMNTQIEKIGFYKSDVTLLVDNYKKQIVVSIIGGISLVSAIIDIIFVTFKMIDL